MVLLFIMVIGVIFYILTPFDVVPDALGVIGFIDDIVVMIGLIIYVINKFLSRFRNQVQDDYIHMHAD
jgi:uncharacterized membrane protein YkvA (DUF1232 family)